MKNKALLVTVWLCCCISFLSAQITTEEKPFSFSMSNLQGLRSISIQTLPIPDMPAVKAEDKINDAQPDGPMRFAYPVKVNYTLTNSGTWQTLQDGSKLWRLSVRLPGALSTNTMYDFNRINLWRNSNI